MEIFKVIFALLLGWGAGVLVNRLAEYLPADILPPHSQSPDNLPPDALPLEKPAQQKLVGSRVRFWLVQAAACAGALWLALAPPERFSSPIGAGAGLPVITLPAAGGGD